VHDYLDAAPGQAAKLVEVAEGVGEGRSPRIASGCRFGGLGEPHRLARQKAVSQLGVVGVHQVGPGEPPGRKRGVCGCLRFRARGPHPCGDRAVEVVAEDIEHWPACRQQILRGQQLGTAEGNRQRAAFTDGAGAEEQSARSGAREEIPEDPDVTAVGRCVVTRRGSANRRVRRFVHELGRSDPSSDLGRVVDYRLSLVRRPSPIAVPHAGPGGDRRDQLASHAGGEVDNPSPLIAGEHPPNPCGGPDGGGSSESWK
jgi:hypothetical protein